MATRSPDFGIILAGGKGTRMRSTDRHKVCFPIDGRPAILRALDVYSASGIARHVVVVGAMAEQVMSTVAQDYGQVIYAYQAEQLGTGDAARHGLAAVEALEGKADVLLVAGDRIIEPMALERLIDLYYGEACDMAFMVGPRGPRSSQGRVLFGPDGAPLANIEMRDVAQRLALARIRRRAERGDPPTRAEAKEVMCERMDEARAAVAFGALWDVLQDEGREPSAEQWLEWIPEADTRFLVRTTDDEMLSYTPEEVEQQPHVNVSVYLVKSQALSHALSQLDRDNAQREEYLSDIINVLVHSGGSEVPPYRVRALRVDDPNRVMAFNNPEELLRIENYYREKHRPHLPDELPSGPGYRAAQDWLRAVSVVGEAADTDGAVERELAEIYGQGSELLAERCAAYSRLLQRANRTLGQDTPVLLVRSPGRVNILGRHIDHQGGHCNLMAIDREIIMAVHPREDDGVHLYNVEGEPFGERHFSIGELVARLPWDDWLSVVDSEPVRQMLCETAGDWSHYVRAAVLRLQKKFPSTKLRGMDLVVQGNIPIAAGLSSSSALVVATAEAAVAVNDLEVYPSQFVDLCGEGEWFVGTRGGSADHAAMKFGERGRVTQVGFFPFDVRQVVPFPEYHRMVICNSHVQARKAAGARDVFNHRVACYRLGLLLVRQRYPQYAPLLEHLRDLNVRTLGIPLSWIYRILLSLPERATREDLQELLPADQLEPILGTHEPVDEFYPIRGVVLFGLAEAERSRLGADLLARNDVEGFGRLMRVSHDGDRVVAHDEQLWPQPYRYRASNAYLLDLMAALETGDPQQVIGAQLQWQPGAYRCSTSEIDLMVDAALGVPGVAGAQLAGAGLGGCMMVLAHENATEALAQRMNEVYYAPRGLEPDVSVCTPIGGSGVLLNPRES